MTQDQRFTIQIRQEDANNGVQHKLVLPDGEETIIPVPPGSYDGQELWFPHQNPSTGNSSPSSFLVITLRVEQNVNPLPPTAFASSPNAFYNQQQPFPSDANPFPPTLSASQNQPISDANSFPHTVAASQNYASNPTPIDNYPPLPANSQNNPPPPPPTYYPQQYNAPPPNQPYTTPPVTYPQQQQARPRTRNWATIWILVFLVVILISGGVVIGSAYLQNTQKDAAEKSATATAVNATATEQGYVNATATAQGIIAEATATVNNNNPNPYGSGTLIFYDKLDGLDKDHSWNTKYCTFQSNNLHVIDNDPTYAAACSIPMKNTVDDFTIEFKMNILQGDSGGVYFRKNSTQKTGYLIYIGTDGYMQLLREGETVSNILKKTSSYFNTGTNKENTIAIKAQGSSLSFFINGNEAASATDSSFSSGDLSLLASTYTDSSKTSTTEVSFSDLKIWKI